MIYERISIRREFFDSLSNPSPHKLFVYLHWDGKAENFTYGVGYESVDTLQREHVPTGIFSVYYGHTRQATAELVLRTGKLKKYFGGYDIVILEPNNTDKWDYLRYPTPLSREELNPYIFVGTEFSERAHRIYFAHRKMEREEGEKKDLRNQARKELFKKRKEAREAGLVLTEADLTVDVGGTQISLTPFEDDISAVYSNFELVQKLDTSSGAV